MWWCVCALMMDEPICSRDVSVVVCVLSRWGEPIALVMLSVLVCALTMGEPIALVMLSVCCFVLSRWGSLLLS